MNTYIASWYVNGRRDVGLVTEVNEPVAREVVKVRLERAGIRPDRGKIRLKRYEPRPMSFIMLTHGGRA